MVTDMDQQPYHSSWEPSIRESLNKPACSRNACDFNGLGRWRESKLETSARVSRCTRGEAVILRNVSTATSLELRNRRRVSGESKSVTPPCPRQFWHKRPPRPGEKMSGVSFSSRLRLHCWQPVRCGA